MQLKVVFDTNSVYTKGNHFLCGTESHQLVTTEFQVDGLTVTWYLPDISRHEREYQIRKQYLEALSRLKKSERILEGLNINGLTRLQLSDEELSALVTANLEEQVKNLGINILNSDPSQVNWEKIKLDAAYRHPPFEPETEKGFRDAMIAQAFCQLVEGSSKDARECLVVLVTSDQRLTDAVEALAGGRDNVRVLKTPADVRELINTLGDPDPELIKQVKKIAMTLFYSKGDPNSLYEKENVLKKIIEAYSDQFNQLPDGADSRKHVKTVIGRPRFEKKIDNRMFWTDRITIRVETYRRDANLTFLPVVTGPGAGYYATGETIESETSTAPEVIEESEGSSRQGSSVRVPYKTGEILFDVTWSADLTGDGKLEDPNFESLSYVDTIWSQS
jgi:hypothetical protein